MNCRYRNDDWCYLKEQSCEKPNEDCRDFEEEDIIDSDTEGCKEAHRRIDER